MKGKPRFYFSFRSPFSWIAWRIFTERMPPEIQAEVEMIPFWEPDAQSQALLEKLGGKFLYRQMSREKHLYILQDIRRLSRSLGYTHVWPIDEDPWWELPNLAYLAAARAGKGPEFRAVTYRARWEDGDNIHEMDVVRRLAEEVGLDPNVVTAAPEDESLRLEAAEVLHRSYQEGVFGVPFFIRGFNKFWGVDRLESFMANLMGTEHRFFEPQQPLNAEDKQ